MAYDKFEDCPGKIHIDNIKEEINEMKAEQTRLKTDIYKKLDAISKWLVGGITSILLAIITAAIMYSIFGG